MYYAGDIQGFVCDIQRHVDKVGRRPLFQDIFMKMIKVEKILV